MKKTAICSIMLVFVLSSLLSAFSEEAKLKQLADKKASPFLRISLAKMFSSKKINEAGPYLADIVKDSSEDLKLRKTCIESIVELKYKDAAGSLLDVIRNKEDNKHIRTDCVSAFEIFDDKKLLIELGNQILSLNDDKTGVTGAFLDLVIKSKYKGDEEFVNMASRLVTDRSPEVRKRVVTILEATNDKKYLSLLMIIMGIKKNEIEVKSSEVRMQAIKAVAKIGGKLAVPAMIDSLEVEKDHEEVRDLLADILNKIEIGPIKKVWLEELDKRIKEEKNTKIKIKLVKALERVKKAQTKQ